MYSPASCHLTRTIDIQRAKGCQELLKQARRLRATGGGINWEDSAGESDCAGAEVVPGQGLILDADTIETFASTHSREQVSRW